MTQLQEIVEGYSITLNGIKANVYETSDGVLISNNDFSSINVDFDEIVISYSEFTERLSNNNGNFKTKGD